MKGQKIIATSGTIPGPVILGNDKHSVKPSRVGFTYSVHPDGVHVCSDLDSDFGVRRIWSNRNVEKNIENARRRLASYGKEISVDALIADGWTVH